MTTTPLVKDLPYRSGRSSRHQFRTIIYSLKNFLSSILKLCTLLSPSFNGMSATAYLLNRLLEVSMQIHDKLALTVAYLSMY